MSITYERNAFYYLLKRNEPIYLDNVFLENCPLCGKRISSVIQKVLELSITSNNNYYMLSQGVFNKINSLTNRDLVYTYDFMRLEENHKRLIPTYKYEDLFLVVAPELQDDDFEFTIGDKKYQSNGTMIISLKNSIDFLDSKAHKLEITSNRNEFRAFFVAYID